MKQSNLLCLKLWINERRPNAIRIDDRNRAQRMEDQKILGLTNKEARLKAKELK